ncbi:uncharacterized protein PHALS_00501 [Plasmopara halstedii]|uniref:Uncharacterized protein n=1 Tax=Plasmopara halstedii TaxID=4781 RepID=A0A0P1A7L0_PLAHL|nr:uncharacterized protein PHALS_00501 [Plasmopara halstedii]CEG36178.1 hypothetical protein PHALS_00501 [Plasmopara halstedii]|eukprot:XP_024572547.1 hypothetical protein PHALS_00501 [Plasmopara halstedii]
MTLLVLRARHLRSNSDKISTRGCEQECIVTSHNKDAEITSPGLPSAIRFLLCQLSGFCPEF